MLREGINVTGKHLGPAEPEPGRAAGDGASLHGWTGANDVQPVEGGRELPSGSFCQQLGLILSLKPARIAQIAG
jgi:hypothetical protein